MIQSMLAKIKSQCETNENSLCFYIRKNECSCRFERANIKSILQLTKSRLYKMVLIYYSRVK